MNDRYQSNFLSRITERRSRLPEMVSEMNASGLPLLLYGAGKYAEIIYNAARKYDLHISDIVVTSLDNNPTAFMGCEVQTVSRALQKYDKCNVLIAFQASSLQVLVSTEKYLLESGCVSQVYFYDGVHSNYYNELNLKYDFVERNQKTLEELYDTLYDDHSRDVMTAYFNQRISGDIRYLRDIYTDDQYFPDFIELRDDEVFVDCGAYDGDTIETFISHMGDRRIAKIYAFEPDELNFSKLTARNFENMTAVQKGAYHEKTTLRFTGRGDTGSAFADFGDCEVEVDMIDNVLQGERATYIKMDIEGAELAAIEGAKNTIMTCKPRLAVCVYHKKEDLITIPQAILAISPHYKLFLRQHLIYAHELVLYAI